MMAACLAGMAALPFVVETAGSSLRGSDTPSQRRLETAGTNGW